MMWMPERGESVYLKKYKCHAIVLNKGFPNFKRGEKISRIHFGIHIRAYTNMVSDVLLVQKSFCYELLIGDIKGWTLGYEFIRAMQVIKWTL